MEIIKSFIDFFLHLDNHMAEIVAQYGQWVYGIVFGIIFAETGLVITPFLPGDSLLFVLGALCAQGSLNLGLLLVLLSIAAILGDMVNYAIGRKMAQKVFNNEKIPFIKKEYLDRTQKYFEKYGPKTIIIARFVPIVRTFAPFLAGVGNMPYKKFALYNITGGIFWVFAGLLAGYFFGNLPFVSEHFSLVVLAIVVISLIPAVIEFVKHRQESK
jgi:membrane-associated protein